MSNKRRSRKQIFHAPKAKAPPQNLPMVTIFADGSYHPVSRAAGWGAWMKGDGSEFGVSAGGPISAPCTCAQQAELYALANALATAEARGLIPEDGIIMLQSDCLEALSVIRYRLPTTIASAVTGGVMVPRAKRISFRFKDCAALEWIVEFMSKPGRHLHVRHVKGHQKDAVGRGWVNHKCDELAKAGMQHAFRLQKERAACS